MRSEFSDKARLKHILDAIGEIEKYLMEADFAVFLENSMMRFACIKQMEIIGEASNHLSFYESVQQDLFEAKFQVNELTSFIIDKSEKPINSNFIYNEK